MTHEKEHSAAIRVSQKTRKALKIMAARYETTIDTVIEMLLKNTDLPKQA